MKKCIFGGTFFAAVKTRLKAELFAALARAVEAVAPKTHAGHSHSSKQRSSEGSGGESAAIFLATFCYNCTLKANLY